MTVILALERRVCRRELFHRAPDVDEAISRSQGSRTSAQCCVTIQPFRERNTIVMIYRIRGVGHSILHWIAILAMLITLSLGASWSSTLAAVQDAGSFPALTPGQRVYDETATSLTPEQITALDRRLQDLKATGADVVVYVRALDADPDATLEQVEAIQQAWVARTGVDQDTAVAILINRNPDDANDARAGIYVGKTYNDGNVPDGEQRAIIDDALIPPLRDGDVYGSLMAGLDRLENSIRNGPPQSAFDRWAAKAAGSWLPWVGLGLAVVGSLAAAALFRSRQTTDQPDQQPTTARPGNLTPALASALVAGSPQPTAIPATLLDLASRGALQIEPESEGGRFSKPKVQIRILQRGPVADEVEETVWRELEGRAEAGVVSSGELQKLAGDTKAVREVLERQMRAEGWLNLQAAGRKATLFIIGVLALVTAIFGGVVAGIGEKWLPVIGVAPLAALAIAAFIMGGTYSNLSRQGQQAAIPWKAYRKGLKDVDTNQLMALDIDAVLPDIVALNLGSAMNERLKQATESGKVLRIFASQNVPGQGSVQGSYFPVWVAYSSTFSAATSSGSTTVSGGGAGGGGGAAGST